MFIGTCTWKLFINDYGIEIRITRSCVYILISWLILNEINECNVQWPWTNFQGQRFVWNKCPDSRSIYIFPMVRPNSCFTYCLWIKSEHNRDLVPSFQVKVITGLDLCGKKKPSFYPRFSLLFPTYEACHLRLLPSQWCIVILFYHTCVYINATSIFNVSFWQSLM